MELLTITLAIKLGLASLAPQTITAGQITTPAKMGQNVSAIQSESNCSVLAAEVWSGTGYDKPMEKDGGELDNGEGCTNPFLPGPKRPEDPLE